VIGTHRFLVYVDDVNTLDGNTDAIKKNTDVILEAVQEDGLEVNTEELYVYVSSPECRRIRNINVAYTFLEKCVKCSSMWGRHQRT